MARDRKGNEKSLVNTDICALSLDFYLKSYLIFKSQYAKKIPNHSWVIPEKSKKLVWMLTLVLILLVSFSFSVTPKSIPFCTCYIVRNALALQFLISIFKFEPVVFWFYDQEKATGSKVLLHPLWNPHDIDCKVEIWQFRHIYLMLRHTWYLFIYLTNTYSTYFMPDIILGISYIFTHLILITSLWHRY